MGNSDEILAELRTLHPRLIDLSLGRIERLLAGLDTPNASCRRSFTLPARTAKDRSRRSSRRCWRRRDGACTSIPRRISSASTSASPCRARTGARGPSPSPLSRSCWRALAASTPASPSPSSRSRRRRRCWLLPKTRPMPCCWRSGSAAVSMRPTSIVRRRSPSSRRSRWIMPTSSATRWRRSPLRRRAS